MSQEAPPALAFEGVSKRFRKGEVYDSLRDLIPAITGRLFKPGANGRDERDFWALKDVSFAVNRGEAFGIIGSNGAGKSTILKLLSGIMQPTHGSIYVDGRLSALIEVGAGFHQDLTGRENIYLNGVILGMRREEVRRKFDEVVAFAGLEEFIDTPVKRYSSGMYARLGFSVAAHVDPDLLIVDEVLSVGDYVFQRKCVDKMERVIKGGATVVFVSHNLRAVTELCQRSLLLERGRVVQIGNTSDVVKTYFDRVYEQSRSSGEKAVHLVNVAAVRVSDESPVVAITPGERIRVDVEVTANEDAERLAVVLVVRDDGDYEVFNTSTERLGVGTFSVAAGERFRCSFELEAHLARGTFHISPVIYRYDTQTAYDEWRPGITFFVESPVDVRGSANLYPTVTEFGLVETGSRA